MHTSKLPAEVSIAVSYGNMQYIILGKNISFVDTKSK